MYTTRKKIGKLSNQLILSWLLIVFALIRLAFKEYHSFDSFRAIGSFLDVVLMIVLGITIMISSNKSIKKIKGIEFSVNDSDFIYKTFDEELVFNDVSPAKQITKTLKTINIVTVENREIILNIDDFLLDFKELKKIEKHLVTLNKQFQQSLA